MYHPLRPIRRVKLILPALTEATSPYWRPIKYSLFPPLGLATLAAYLDPNLEIDLQDEHVEPLNLDDEPDLVVIQAYITNAKRAYRIADHYRRRRAHVALGDCTSRRFPKRRRRMPIRSSSVPARTRSRRSCAISPPARRCGAINRRCARSQEFRQSAAI
jgi:hypothetical protein